MKLNKRITGAKRSALLLAGLGLLFVGGVVAADQKSGTGKTHSSSRGQSPERPAADSRVLSTRPAAGNGVKVRVLTKDGRVRDMVIKKNQDR